MSEKQNVEYKYTAVPTNLFMCLDNNCRSTLFALIQLSTYYASDDGWFFRTNADLQAETNLSKNVLNGALDALYQAGIIDIIPQAKGRHEARKYKVLFDKFINYESLSIEDCMKNPDYAIDTTDYKHGKPSFQLKLQPTTQPKLRINDNNIDNTANEENVDNRIESEPHAEPISNPMSKSIESNPFGSIDYEKSITSTEKESTQVGGIETNTDAGREPQKPITYVSNIGSALEKQLVDALRLLHDYDKNHKPYDATSKAALKSATIALMQKDNYSFERAKKEIEWYRKQLIEMDKETEPKTEENQTPAVEKEFEEFTNTIVVRDFD